MAALQLGREEAARVHMLQQASHVLACLMRGSSRLHSGRQRDDQGCSEGNAGGPCDILVGLETCFATRDVDGNEYESKEDGGGEEEQEEDDDKGDDWDSEEEEDYIEKEDDEDDDSKRGGLSRASRILKFVDLNAKFSIIVKGSFDLVIS